MSNPETVEDAIEQVALGMVRTQKENGREIEFMSIKDMKEADQYLTAKRAAAKPHFGLRMTKCVPPGGG